MVMNVEQTLMTVIFIDLIIFGYWIHLIRDFIGKDKYIESQSKAFIFGIAIDYWFLWFFPVVIASGTVAQLTTMGLLTARQPTWDLQSALVFFVILQGAIIFGGWVAQETRIRKIKHLPFKESNANAILSLRRHNTTITITHILCLVASLFAYDVLNYSMYLINQYLLDILAKG